MDKIVNLYSSTLASFGILGGKEGMRLSWAEGKTPFCAKEQGKNRVANNCAKLFPSRRPIRTGLVYVSTTYFQLFLNKNKGLSRPAPSFFFVSSSLVLRMPFPNMSLKMVGSHSKHKKVP
jgi:hypothetical protein